ncbi:MAG: hypothetical protein AAGF49_01515, partial [Pseudomonadota bacterium]
HLRLERRLVLLACRHSLISFLEEQQAPSVAYADVQLSGSTSYRYEKVENHGKLMVRDEPLATIVQAALEGYASGRFETPVEVKRFLENAPDFPKDRDGTIHPSRVTELLTRPHYAGYLTHENWDLHMVPAKH